MAKSSAAISLVLLGSASAALIGYKAVTGPHHANNFQSTGFNDGGSDFGPDDGQDGNAFDPAATQPTTNAVTGAGHSNTYHSYTHYSHSGTSGFVGSSGRISSGSSGGSSGSSAHSAGTSRGGFGSTGHAVGHASS